MKLRIISLAMALGLLATISLGTIERASAQETYSVQKNGAAGLVAVVVNVSDVLDNSGTIDIAVVELNNSLNNLRALNNVLNNSPILSNNNIDITVYDVVDVANVLNNNQVTVLNDFLNNNTDLIDAIVGIGVLSSGDLIAFTA